MPNVNTFQDLLTRGVEVDELLAVAVLVIVEGGRDGPSVGGRRPAARLTKQSTADPASPNYDACNARSESNRQFKVRTSISFEGISFYFYAASCRCACSQ